jgi:hypothetical protein
VGHGAGISGSSHSKDSEVPRALRALGMTSVFCLIDKEFPSGAYLSEHWSKDDASAYAPAGSPVPSDLAHEPVEVFAKRNAPPPAPRKELVVVRRALEENGANVVLASLRSQGVARRLRRAPAEQLLLDRALMVRPWGRASTGVSGARY